MKTKEEILDRLLPHRFYTPVHPKGSEPIHDDDCKRCKDEDMIEEAMDIYAKEVAVAFAKYMTNDRLFTYATMDDFFNKFLSEQQSIKQ